MRFFESLGLALTSIKAHKLRSFLTLLGIIFGVATVGIACFIAWSQIKKHQNGVVA